ncbi:MAG: FHA domain-containing protein [Sulfuritalea sp.]|nr:FHA domain-containing protein [Sulfuritalea sp.]
MLKLYIFWGLFALVLIGIVGTLIRDRRNRRLKREAEEAKSRATVAPGDGAAISPPVAAFDPAATRVHVRTTPVGTHSALPSRDEVKLPSEAAPRLVCVGGTQKDHSFPVTVAGITVGRDTDNDIVITDARASHRHAWVGIVDRKVVLRDLGSTNGTFLNAKIDSPVSEVVLSPGDTIFFGGHGRDQFRLVVA